MTRPVRGMPVGRGPDSLRRRRIERAKRELLIEAAIAYAGMRCPAFEADLLEAAKAYAKVCRVSSNDT